MGLREPSQLLEMFFILICESPGDFTGVSIWNNSLSCILYCMLYFNKDVFKKIINI